MSDRLNDVFHEALNLRGHTPAAILPRHLVGLREHRVFFQGAEHPLEAPTRLFHVVQSHEADRGIIAFSAQADGETCCWDGRTALDCRWQFYLVCVSSRMEQQPMAQKKTYWTHPSVLRLAPEDDPVDIIANRSRAAVYRAIEEGWKGPPFDPLALADMLRIRTDACDDVLDARTVPGPGDGLTIQYNPNRPRDRMRFSVAHELAHTFFPDCSLSVRERMARKNMRDDEWQLEMLCNVGAAEMLMPIGTLKDLPAERLAIDALLDLRVKFQVSTEAVLLRAVKLTQKPCFAFVCAMDERQGARGRYRIDYASGSRAVDRVPSLGSPLPKGSCVEECTAIGFTAKREEEWGKRMGPLRVECVGIPPYPGRQFPRVAGIAAPAKPEPRTVHEIRAVVGDATEPRGPSPRILAFIINDKGFSWGAGFAKVVQTKWPVVRQDFSDWVRRQRPDFRLGNCHECDIDDDMTAFEMVCQHGYGPSRKPRIRYLALEECLEALAEEAACRRASVHMPRIGCGEAGGTWAIIGELVERILCSKGVDVTVYDLPKRQRSDRAAQPGLFDRAPN